MLGPLLPTLAAEWRLTDAQSGLLIAAKFTGATLGGLSVPRRLRQGIAAGHTLAAIGFFALSLAHGLPTALPALFVSGIGLGLIIASSNVLIGRRWGNHPGSALALLNLFWSFGAVSCGLLAAATLPRFGWRTPTHSFAAVFAPLALLTFPWLRRVLNPQINASSGSSLPWPQTFAFGLSLLLYGGLETCLTVWLTTYALRLGGAPLAAGQSAFVLLWSALTIGRLLSSVAMHLWKELPVLRLALLCTLAAIGLLIAAHTPNLLSAASIGLGIVLSAVFPSTFALLMQHSPSSRLAGSLLAVSGLGAALFPWLMGAISTATGSLRLSMTVPLLLAAALLPLSLRFDRSEAKAKIAV